MRKSMKLVCGLKVPEVSKISGRSSTITGTIVNGVVPVIYPDEKQIKENLEILKQNAEDLRCAYCGDVATEWDHFLSLVDNKKPTGYITEINNLIPACGKCNQSRGKKDYAKWMTGNARKSPARKLTKKEIEDKIEIIRAYEANRKRTKINPKDIENTDEWIQLEKIRVEIIEKLKLADDLALALRNKLIKYVIKNNTV